MDTTQPPELAAEIKQLGAEQKVRTDLEQAGSALNDLAGKMQKLALVIHKNGLRLQGARSLATYGAGNLELPEFRSQGSNYSLVSVPVNLADYKEAPPLTEVIGSEWQSVEMEAANKIELERLLVSSELVKSEQRLHLMIASGDKSQRQSLQKAVESNKARLQQLKL